MQEVTNSESITFIGVDIAKSKFDICLYNGDFSNCKYETYSNDLDGFYEFFSFIESSNDLINIRIGIPLCQHSCPKLMI